jgi:hypothetical protein
VEYVGDRCGRRCNVAAILVSGMDLTEQALQNRAIPLSTLSTSSTIQLTAARWRARTDLGFLCRDVLGYKDVSDDVHGPVLDIVQKFPSPTREEFDKNDRIERGRWVYTPVLEMTKLPGKRRVLILDPRGHLKTTINAIAHTIQWIINYPNIAIQIIQSNNEKAELILGEIKKHFQANPRFRALFPEHCPQRKLNDFGTLGEFTTMARDPEVVRKEKTVMTGSIDKGSAGLHFDVMKFSDIVEPNNAKGDSLYQVAKSFYLMENLLVSPEYWIDVEGTRYHFADLYGQIIKFEMSREPADREYKIHVRGVYKKKTPDGKPQQFIPEELDEQKYPLLLDEFGRPQPWWPSRFPTHKLEGEKARDAYIFSCQKMNYPQGGIDGQQTFPAKSPKTGHNLPVWIPREKFRQEVRVAFREVIIDTGETANKRSNHTAIVTAAWSSNGRCFIEEIDHGKFLPSETVNRIILATLKHRPRAVKIEETSFVRGLMPALRREMDLHSIMIPVDLIKRDNQVAKVERIYNTLQPWYVNEDLRFVEPFHSDPKEFARIKTHLEKELNEFPLGEDDDILDALADAFQNKEWFGRETPKLTFIQAAQDGMKKLLGLEDPWDPLSPPETVAGMHPYSLKTGGL